MLISVSLRSSIWKSTLLIPVYLALASGVLFLLHLLILATPLKRYFSPLSQGVPSTVDDLQPIGIRSTIRANIRSNGGLAIWSYKLLRLLGCVALFGVTVSAAVITNDDTLHTSGKHWGKKKHRNKNKHMFSNYEWILIFLSLFYVRSLIRALPSLFLTQ